jgi:N-methylhydantoinase A
MDFRLDSDRTWYHECSAVDPSELEEQYRELEAEARARLLEHGSDEIEVELTRTAGMRYVGQPYEVETPVPGGPLGEGSVNGLIEAFHDVHEREHGVRSDDFDVAIVNLRVTAVGRLPKPDLDSSAPGGAAAGGEAGSRPVYFDGAWIDTPVHPGGTLREIGTVTGPAIIQYEETTLVLPPGSEGRTDEDQNVIISIQERN